HRALPSFPTRRSSDLGQAIGNLLDDLPRDLAAAARQLQLVEELLAATHRGGGDLRQALVGDEHMPCRTVEARAFALGAGLLAEVDRKSTRLNSSHVKI